MKGAVLVAAVIAGLGAAFAPSVGFGPFSRKNTIAERAATALIERLAEGRFAEAAESWDTAMARRLPADSLASIWRQLVDQVGPLSATGRADAVPLSGLRAVDVPVEFARRSLIARVTYDRDGKVVGLLFRPRS